MNMVKHRVISRFSLRTILASSSIVFFAACGDMRNNEYTETISPTPLPTETSEEITLPLAAAASGYRQIYSNTGIVCYQQDVAGGEPDFVCEADLNKARFRTIHGPIRQNISIRSDH